MSPIRSILITVKDPDRRSQRSVETALRIANGIVTLHGSVTSLRKKDEAQRTACPAPGVRQVHNKIRVNPPVQPAWMGM